MNLPAADQDNNRRNIHKSLGKKRSRTKKVPANEKAETKHAVCFGQCFTSPLAYLANVTNQTDTEQLKYRAQHISLAFRRIIEYVSWNKDTCQYVWLTETNCVLVGNPNTSPKDIYTYCLPGCGKCKPFFTAPTRLNINNIKLANDKKCFNTIDKAINDAKNDKKRIQQLNQWDAKLPRKCTPYYIVIRCRKLLLRRREKKNKLTDNDKWKKPCQTRIKTYVQFIHFSYILIMSKILIFNDNFFMYFLCLQS